MDYSLEHTREIVADSRRTPELHFGVRLAAGRRVVGGAAVGDLVVPPLGHLHVVVAGLLAAGAAAAALVVPVDGVEHQLHGAQEAPASVRNLSKQKRSNTNEINQLFELHAGAPPACRRPAAGGLGTTRTVTKGSRPSKP
uniref:Uncharacterized protein n=1 Tax=Oryza meridionalis TaxID=40149 RepID=A0A0E0DRL8_9ORYZ